MKKTSTENKPSGQLFQSINTMQLLSNGPNLSLYDVAYNWRQIQLWQHKNKKQILARESAKKKKKGSFMEG